MIGGENSDGATYGCIDDAQSRSIRESRCRGSGRGTNEREVFVSKI